MSGMLLGACAPLSELDGSGSVMPSQRAVQSQSAKLDSVKAQGSMLHLDGAKVSTLTSDDNNFNVVAQQRGQASWYGGRFHGRKTASGERFDMHGDTAAHRTWPLGTWVRVTNLRNQRSVILRINDRGPFHSKRILDVSKSAAHRLEFHHHGSAPILLERLRSKPAVPSGASTGDVAPSN